MKRNSINPVRIRYLLIAVSYWLVTVYACTSGTSPSTKTTDHSYDSILTRVDDYLKTKMLTGFAGVVLIANQDSIIFHKAYSNSIDKIDTGTAFYLASNRKSFAATAIMQLQERGMLSIKDSLGKYFANVPADKRGITLHALLTHTSGLSYCNCVDGESDKQKVVQGILRANLDNPIGEKWVYQNENYLLLEFIVAQVSGMSFKDYVKENILNPAGMRHTGFWGFEKDVPVTIAPLNDSIRITPLYQKIFENGIPKPGLIIGMFSTSNDLYKWTQALQNGKLLSESSLENSFKPYPEAMIHNERDTVLYYSYGWIPTLVNDKRINIFHTGREDWMMNNRIYMLDNGFTIIVWAMDKTGPYGDAMATIISKELVSRFEKLNY
jgi:CubicO group peptidase (beta-lactamase class C family)